MTAETCPNCRPRPIRPVVLPVRQEPRSSLTLYGRAPCPDGCDCKCHAELDCDCQVDVRLEVNGAGGVDVATSEIQYCPLHLAAYGLRQALSAAADGFAAIANEADATSPHDLAAYAAEYERELRALLGQEVRP